jgi:hypothetical protein
MSAQCPQTVPRKPANVGEGQRNLDVSLTWLFALTEALIGVDCEVVCEADTELITQRSQVQILPPLQESCRSGLVSWTIDARLRRPMPANCPLTLRRESS